MKSFLLSCIFFFPLLTQAETTVKYLDRHYGTNARQIFDFWGPSNPKTATPLVIYIHGGGFSSGTKDEMRQHPILINQYVQRGIAVASIEYRFLKEIALQDIMKEDIAGFVQFIRYHAPRYNIDPKKIYSYGISAGASASLWLATHDDIANPASSDPLKRLSSRISAAGHLEGQVSYDYTVWYNFYGKEATDKFIGSEVWTRYHLKSYDDIFTPEGLKIRRDLDMYGNLTADDPPLFFYASLADLPDKDANHFVHSPRHARNLSKKSKSLGIETATQIIADGAQKSDAHQSVFKFFTGLIDRPGIR